LATRSLVASALGRAITAQAPTLVAVAHATHATVAEVSTLTVHSGIGGAAPSVSSATTGLLVSGQQITLQGTFLAGQTLSVTVNGTAVSYTVSTADIGETDDITRNRLAIALANAISAAAPRLIPVVTATASTTTTDGVAVTQLRISQVTDAPAFTLSFTDTTRLAVEHNPSSELSYDQQQLVASKMRPALETHFKDLTDGQ
jgi:hypothetical protein